jgi:hypothetical protein
MMADEVKGHQFSKSDVEQKMWEADVSLGEGAEEHRQTAVITIC